MYIKKLRVYNYKSYFDSGVMEFTPGINIIVGKNNAGKTSLLEVLTLNFEYQPHRILDFEKYPDRIKRLPNKSSRIEDESRIEITLHIEKEELWNFIKEIYSNTHIAIPQLYYDDKEYYCATSPGEPLTEVEFFNDKTKEAFKKFQDFLKNSDPCKLNLTLNSSKQLEKESLIKLLNFDSYETTFYSDRVRFYKLNYDDNGKLKLEYNEYDDEDTYCRLGGQFSNYKGTVEDSIGKKLFDIFVSRSYRFKAERLNIGICKFENNNQLKSDASNLAEVLSILPGKKPGTFSEFNKKVSSILDEIKYISVVPRDNSEVEIKVWMTEELNRDDLSFPLSSCGSGVGQVLAIVYILVSSEEPRTLIIDEPQSFLHPGAAKKLIETIKQFPQHQYFIATHSPDIITTADPTNIIKLKYENCETTASAVMDEEKIKLQKEILTELGVRLSDVFGADSIIWVEGETEQDCYPLILEKILKIPLMGIKILPVGSPDALLDGKLSERVADIYKRLTVGAGLFPPAIAFIFDRENKDDDKIKKLKDKNEHFHFLQRRMYENYILNPEAIAEIINEEGGLEIPITINQIKEYLNLENIKSIEQKNIDNREKEKLFPGINMKTISDDNWLLKVHGANLLEKLFQNFCGTGLEFKKTTHSYKITEWIIKHQPEFLSELAKELKECLNKNKS
ncbi:AAA family ATPase [Cronbergia sp. UHCC 0137]|uniref:AAA family ATPase n=1 Tax=Cronbergia sp. UHCC 0137 TaxID=3110239 RepID=UPI002B2156F7|nr:AAA family ATPase [Cronbergia sp. UHCC 0137]MEA5616547.1 AAA family ATPase [Cronbergia sp. UHCC 0137]